MSLGIARWVQHSSRATQSGRLPVARIGQGTLLRVNPNITVDVEVTAGSLNTERLPHLGKVRVTAGGAKLLDVNEINDALIQAGQATISGAITTGRNRIRASPDRHRSPCTTIPTSRSRERRSWARWAGRAGTPGPVTRSSWATAVRSWTSRWSWVTRLSGLAQIIRHNDGLVSERHAGNPNGPTGVQIRPPPARAPTDCPVCGESYGYPARLRLVRH